MPAKEFDAFTRLDASDVNAYLANKSISNAIINGAFDIWQRGTSFTNTSLQEYTADRWREYTSAMTVEQSTDVPNNNFSFSLQSTLATTGFNIIGQRIESSNARFLSDTVTLSFWGKSVSGTAPIRFNARRANAKDNFATTTSLVEAIIETAPSSDWKQYSVTFTLTTEAKQNGIEIRFIRDNVSVYRITGVQLESGTVANDFRRNANSIQGELAACQRYYWRAGGQASFQQFGVGTGNSSTIVQAFIVNPVFMRSAPTSLDFANLGVTESVSTLAVTSASIGNAGINGSVCNFTVASGVTQFRPYAVNTNNSLSGFLGFSAEL